MASLGVLMLLICRPTDVLSDRLFLPDWIRAPLYLGEGARYFAALESHKRSNGNVELVISSIDNMFWDDIWRIEVDTLDAPGNALILFDLLESRGFNILAAESSVNSFSDNHTTSIIISAAEYENFDDRSNIDRIRMSNPSLSGLRREIIAYLGDKISFKNDDDPKLKISHIRSLKTISDDLKSGSRFILNRTGDFITDGTIRLTTRAKEHLSLSIGSDKMIYAPSVDTKNRLIRVIFSGFKDFIKHDIQIIISSEFERQFQIVYKKLFNAKANVVRSLIRPCPSNKAKSIVVNLLPNSKYIDDLHYRTFDITFDFLAKGDEQGGLEEIGREFRELTESSKGGFSVVRKSWET